MQLHDISRCAMELKALLYHTAHRQCANVRETVRTRVCAPPLVRTRVSELDAYAHAHVRWGALEPGR